MSGPPAACAACGLELATLAHHEIVGRLRVLPRRYRESFGRFEPDEDREALLRRRPEPDVWSALEYAAHAGDMLDLLSPAIQLMEVEDDPTVYFFDPEEQAEEMEYNTWSTIEVLGRMETACADLSSVIEFVGRDRWGRRGRFPWGEQDIRASALQAVHEGHHHLHDVDRVLATVRAAEQ